MDTPLFTGCATALVTPFTYGKVDGKTLERLVERQIAAGVQALVPCGSTGEAATLTHDEHREVVRLVVHLAKGRVPVIVGTGSNSTAEAVALTKAAQEAGADAALLISPYYNKPTQGGICQHYRAIAEAARFPLIVYNIPGRTGSKVEAATIAKLADIEYVVGLKDATGSLDEVQEVIRLCGNRLAVYSGDDAMTVPMMAVGAVGVISVVSNVVPKPFRDVVGAAAEGDFDLARVLNYQLLPLMRALCLETNPIPVKAALAMLGLCCDELRLPLTPMSEGSRAKLHAALKDLGVLP